MKLKLDYCGIVRYNGNNNNNKLIMYNTTINQMLQHNLVLTITVHNNT